MFCGHIFVPVYYHLPKVVSFFFIFSLLIMKVTPACYKTSNSTDTPEVRAIFLLLQQPPLLPREGCGVIPGPPPPWVARAGLSPTTPHPLRFYSAAAPGPGRSLHPHHNSPSILFGGKKVGSGNHDQRPHFLPLLKTVLYMQWLDFHILSQPGPRWRKRLSCPARTLKSHLPQIYNTPG